MVDVGDKVGPYRIERCIGVGGFAEVYQATRDKLGKKVALKILSKESRHDSETVKRFLREGRALGQFDKHPGVVSVSDVGECSDHGPYLAMELLEGQTLRAWLNARPGPIPVPDALLIAHQIAGVVKDIHAKDVVHRDLKPENIMLVEPGEYSKFRLTILDFGIARLPAPMDVDSQAMTNIQTAGTSILGTYKYISPEQCDNAEQITGKADVYSLGILLYEMLAGKVPFEANTTVKLLGMHLFTSPIPLRDIDRKVPESVANFVALMLEKNPQLRPSMRECAERLGEIAAEECTRDPEKALPKRRRRIGAAIVIFVALVAGVGFVSQQLRLANERRRQSVPSAKSIRISVDAVAQKLTKAWWRVEFEERAWSLRKELSKYEELKMMLEESLREVRAAEQSRPGERIRDLIAVLNESSEFERKHGRLRVAEKHVTEALELLEERLRVDPKNTQFLADQAMSLSKRGKIRMAEEDAVCALHDFQASVDVINPIPKKKPDEWMILATSRLELGQAKLLARDNASAAEAFTTARTSREHEANSTGDPYWRIMFSEAFLFQAKSTEDAVKVREYLDQAFDGRREMDSHDETWLQKAIFARIQCEYGNLHLREHDLPKAREKFESAREIAKELHEQARTHKDNALILVESLRGLEAVAETPTAKDSFKKNRCELVRTFADRDPDDKRFVFSDCTK